ncbi:hypothetical protein JCM13210_09320 [Thermaerobacter litoralis]
MRPPGRSPEQGSSVVRGWVGTAAGAKGGSAVKRLVKWLAGLGLAAFLLVGTGGTSEAKMMVSPWEPSSVTGSYDIQAD